MTKRSIIAGGLLAVAGLAHAAFWDHHPDKKIEDNLLSPMLVAVPNDPNTSIIQVYDPNDPSFPHFPLLLTESTGYQIECSNIPKLKNMFTGLGFDPDMLAWMEQVAVDDARVVGSGYELNPSLHCDNSAQLLSVDFPNESKFFLDLDGLSSNKVNHIGCQGLLDAMGYDISTAYKVDPGLFGIYFNAADANDIHCMNGVPVGETGSCGDYANGESWDQLIQNGTQTYICIDGVSQTQGDPTCESGFEPNNGQCVYVPQSCGSHNHGSFWSERIAYGSQSYGCNDGNITALGAPVCDSGYEASGLQCIYKPKNCGDHSHGSSWIVSITNGTQSFSCHDGSTVAGNVTCNNGFNWNGSICAYVPKTCKSPVNNTVHAHASSWTDNIANGARSFSCDDGSVTNTSNTCHSQYSWNGSSCAYVPRTCKSPVTNEMKAHGSSWTDSISNGSRSFKCSDGSVSNTANNCHSNYSWNGSSCVYVPKNCGSRTHNTSWSESISNGDVTKKCYDGKTSITKTTCDSHYKIAGVGQCTYEYYNCGSRLHNTTWNEHREGNRAGWCDPPRYRDTKKCYNGTVSLLDSVETWPGIPRRPGYECNH